MIFRILYTIFVLALLSPAAIAQTPAKPQTASGKIVQERGEVYTLDNALSSSHLAVWNSHGRYYNQIEGAWIWQRARLMGTVEDMHTTDYTLNYLVPMLENAGAYVFMPRERDYNVHEYIIDNDSPHSSYREQGEWHNGRRKGFAHIQAVYDDFTNPFEQGTYRWCKSTKGDATAFATWNVEVEQSGSYAVYIAYSIVKNGAADARYTVHHAGGESEFSVNQTMGGGTWIYLGTFDFVQGGNNRVVLSNHSQYSGQYITADAIKVGGGMGNVARKPCLKPRKATKEALKNQKEEARRKKSKRSKKKKEKKADIEIATTSGMPRYAEAARYWLQWAGVPDTIYSDTGGDNDYGDDVRGRAYWVNYLCGGSEVLPDTYGLNIPIDMAFAFHSDAGNVEGDSIVGSMGIYYTGKKRSRDLRFANRVSRKQSEYLHNRVKGMVARDIQEGMIPDWTMRKSLNRRYAEARLLDVPCILFESMSHQNFTDMRYGLDPRFKFAMSRAIYKGILQYMSQRNKTPYIVQPLPVSHMSTRWLDDSQVELSWQSTCDTLETTAVPTAYKVYTRCGEFGWDKGVVVKEPRYSVSLTQDIVYSFYVTALNAGGESFPSEVLSACRSSKSFETVMIVNAFDRVSAPYAMVDTASHSAGFLYDIDGGVPYRYTVAYTGEQYNYDRTSEWKDDLIDPGFGASHSDYDGQLIAGNTFDYPYRHGKILATLGYSFLSTSDEALYNCNAPLSPYRYVDVILGKERATIWGNDSSRYDFEALPQALTSQLTQYCNGGGNLLISGAYIGQDAYDGALASSQAQSFMREVLHCEWLSARSAHDNAWVNFTDPAYSTYMMQWKSRPNRDYYAVEQTDMLYPADDMAVTFLQYPDGNSAAVACKTDLYRCCTLGFPIEVIESEKHKKELFQVIFEFLNNTP